MDDTGVASEQYRIEYDSDVIIARAAAARMARRAGFSKKSCDEISISVSELATNIVKYASPGTIRIRISPGPAPVLVVVAEDHGTGIENVDNAFAEFHTDRGPTLSPDGFVRPLKEGLGCGLSAVRRLMDTVSVDTVAGRGTRITATRAATGEEDPP